MAPKTSKPSKLHELLAVDTSLKGQAQKLLADMKATTFEKKRHLFTAKIVTYEPLEEGAEKETREHSDIQAWVPDEIEWLNEKLAKAMDVGYAIDAANTTAKADIVLDDDTELGKDVPATALLQLGHRVKELQELILAIPTLDPAKGFKADPDSKKGVYKAREVLKPSTKKEQEPILLVAPTKEFPGQAQLITKDRVVGKVREQEWSSLITPNTKALMLERVEDVGRAIASARARANQMEINPKDYKIGKKLLDYIFQPLA